MFFTKKKNTSQFAVIWKTLEMGASRAFGFLQRISVKNKEASISIATSPLAKASCESLLFSSVSFMAMFNAKDRGLTRVYLYNLLQ